jgi:RNA polymerase sigma factor for flagellar operon FliA
VTALTATEQALVSEAYPVVHAAARMYARRFAGISEEELRGAGYEALLGLVKRHDPAKGAFAEFAKRSVYGAVLDACFAIRGWRRRGLDLVRAFQQRHPLQADASPTSLEAVMAKGEEQPRESALQTIRSRAAALATVLLVSDPPHQEDELVARETYNRSLRVLSAVVERLEPQERAVVQGIYWEHRTLSEIAATLSVSQKTVQRLAERAREKLRAALLAEGIEGAPEARET